MRLNKLLIAFIITSTTIFSACKDYEDTVVPSPAVSSDCPAVRFVSDNQTQFELDPNALSFSVKVVRDNATNAVEVPVTVVTNSDNKFTIPSTVSFPAGKDTATLTIAMNPTATKGELYDIEIKFADEYVNPYKVEYPTYKGEASISIWESLGTTQMYDSFSFYHVAEVTLWKNTETANVYRISSPYKEDILLDAEWVGWIGGATQDKIIFTVNGTNVTWDKFWYTNLLYEGTADEEIKAYLHSTIGKTGDSNSIVVKNTDGSIKYFKLYPYFYVDGVGGWGMKVVYVAFPGFDLATALGITVFGS